MTGNSPRPNPRRASTDAVAVPCTWSEFVRGEREDRRIRRWSVGIGLSLHLVLAGLASVLIPPPTTGTELPPERPEPVRVMPEVRVQPERVPPTPEIPPPMKPRVPVPVPEHMAPEPVAGPDHLALDTDFEPPDIGVFSIPIPEPPPAVSQGPISVRGEVVPPVRIAGPDPRYTEIARRVRVEGLVIVEAIVSERGSVENVKLVQGLGFGLDEAAMQAIRTWRFEPATLHGEPVAVYYSLTVNFSID